jgi:hypothetical protein
MPSTPNLTEEKGLVRRLSSVAPCPDHYLVVFKRIGDGQQLRSCVPPGEVFRKPLFESLESFTAFAVPGDRNLRHRFERSYKSHDLLHQFTLTFTLYYRVSDPGVLAQKLNIDPLKRLEDEVDLLLVQRNKSLNWHLIEREQIDLENQIFHATSADREEGSNHEKLARFASTQGLEVKRVVVTRDLPEQEIKKGKLVLDHEVLELDQTLALQRQDLKSGHDRRNEVAAGITKNVVRAFDQATDQIRSLDDIKRAVPKVAEIQGAVLGVASGGIAPGMAATETAALHSGSHTGLALSSMPLSPLQALLATISATLGTVACGTGDRRLLLSAALHVIAEATRGENAREERLEHYVGALSETFGRLVSPLGNDQLQLLRRLQDTEGLKRELKLEGGAA